jgi:hypothetical protein
MTRENDLEVESGPYIVLSDGSTFDDALECEISYLSRNGDEEVIEVQNRSWASGDLPGTHFDSADPGDIYSIPLREILRFYFENNPNEDPMR